MANDLQPEREALFQGIDHIDMAVSAVELRFYSPGEQPMLKLSSCVKSDGTRIANASIRHIAVRRSAALFRVAAFENSPWLGKEKRR